MNEKHIRSRLKHLLRRSENQQCADCRAETPKWASFSLGLFVCMNCAAVHRSMGTHISKVRSVNLDKWDIPSVKFMASVGNEKANAFWEASLPHEDRIDSHASDKARDIFIRDKYQHRKFVSTSKSKSKKSSAVSARGKARRSGRAAARNGRAKEPAAVYDDEEEYDEQSDGSANTAESDPTPAPPAHRAHNPSPWVSKTSVASRANVGGSRSATSSPRVGPTAPAGGSDGGTRMTRRERRLRRQRLQNGEDLNGGDAEEDSHSATTESTVESAPGDLGGAGGSSGSSAGGDMFSGMSVAAGHHDVGGDESTTANGTEAAAKADSGGGVPDLLDFGSATTDAASAPSADAPDASLAFLSDITSPQQPTQQGMMPQPGGAAAAPGRRGLLDQLPGLQQRFAQQNPQAAFMQQQMQPNMMQPQMQANLMGTQSAMPGVFGGQTVPPQGGFARPQFQQNHQFGAQNSHMGVMHPQNAHVQAQRMQHAQNGVSPLTSQVQSMSLSPNPQQAQPQSLTHPHNPSTSSQFSNSPLMQSQNPAASAPSHKTSLDPFPPPAPTQPPSGDPSGTGFAGGSGFDFISSAGASSSSQTGVADDSDPFSHISGPSNAQNGAGSDGASGSSAAFGSANGGGGASQNEKNGFTPVTQPEPDRVYVSNPSPEAANAAFDSLLGGSVGANSSNAQNYPQSSVISPTDKTHAAYGLPAANSYQASLQQQSQPLSAFHQMQMQMQQQQVLQQQQQQQQQAQQQASANADAAGGFSFISANEDNSTGDAASTSADPPAEEPVKKPLDFADLNPLGDAVNASETKESEESGLFAGLQGQESADNSVQDGGGASAFSFIS